jgi:hypothetical protein
MSALPLRPWSLSATAYARDRHPHLAALAVYVALSAAATWPLLPRFTAALAGPAEAVRALWGFWWWKHALFTEWRSPFGCDLLGWPAGVSLASASWDLPSTLAALPLWPAVPHLPEVALYNAALLVSFVLTGLFTYLLCRELWGGWLGPLAAGAFTALGTWHFAQAAAGALPLASAQWCPLYFLGLVRTVRHRGPGGPLLGGAALALAAVTSFHHLFACLIGTAVLLACWIGRDRQALLAPAVLRRYALLASVFALLAGWRYAAMLGVDRPAPARAATAEQASADLAAFFLPNPANAWSPSRAAAPPWSGDGAYFGYLLLALGVAGAVRSRAARPWLAAAAAGALFALGPHLHAGGRAFDRLLLPYGWLERIAPGLEAGAPLALAWLAPFGLAVAAAFALDDLARSRRRGAILALGLAALALVEVWPRALPTTAWPSPRFLRSLALDPERWTVLDASSGPRALWNQVLHGHPQLGVPLAPPPLQLAQTLADAPALRPLLDPISGLSAGPAAAPLDRREAVAALQALRVRFVIVEADKLGRARELHLPLAYAGDDLWVFEVPPPVPPA